MNDFNFKFPLVFKRLKNHDFSKVNHFIEFKQDDECNTTIRYLKIDIHVVINKVENGILYYDISYISDEDEVFTGEEFLLAYRDFLQLGYELDLVQNGEFENCDENNDEIEPLNFTY